MNAKVDESHRQQAYRLAYVISQFPILRMQITGKVSTQNDKVASVLASLWGTQQISVPYQVMSTLMRSNLDADVRTLLSHADLRKTLELGTQLGFFLSNTPTGLGSSSTLSSVRSEASAGMGLQGSRVEELNDRLASPNSPLWFVVESEKLASNTSEWIRKQWETSVKEHLRSLLQNGLGDEQVRGDMQRWFFTEYLRSYNVVERASRQYLCAEMAAATALLQVVVIDDEVTSVGGTKALATPVSSNVLRFRSVYKGKLDDVYGAWYKNMQEHNEALLVLKHIAETCLLRSGDPEYKALYNSVTYISRVDVQMSPGQAKKAVYPGGTYRGSFLADLKNVATKTLSDAVSTVRRVVTGSSKYRLAHFVAEWTQKLRTTAGKAFVFYLAESSITDDKKKEESKRMRPGWHTYAARDNRPSEDDDAVIKEWIGALLAMDVDTSKYSPIDQKQVDTCKRVVTRAADKLGFDSSEWEKLVKLACETSDSCLDRQYDKVRDLPGDTEDRANALARLLLAYNDIGCGEQTVDTGKGEQTLLKTLLCQRRVAKACDKVGDAECGVTATGGDKDKLMNKMCGPKEPLRNELSKCAVPDGDVEQTKRYKDDASCIRDVIMAANASNATCMSELETKCDEGREGWALIQSIRNEGGALPTSIVKVCAPNQQAKDILEVLDRTKSYNICQQLTALLQVEDDVFKALVTKVKEIINCRKNGGMLNFESVSALTKFNQATKASLTKNGTTINYLPGGMVVSPEEYEDKKLEFAMDKTAPKGKINEMLTEVFQMISDQCVGMEGVKGEDILTGPYNVPRFVHRMLYPQFKDLVYKNADLYTVAVGREYVDWMLIVLNRFLLGLQQPANEAIPSLIDKVDTMLQKDQTLKKTFRNDTVKQHLYDRMYNSVPNSVDAQRHGRLKIGLEVMVNVGRMKAIHPKQMKWHDFENLKFDLGNQKSKTLKEVLNDIDLNQKRIAVAKGQGVRKYADANPDWWRKLLTMTTMPEANDVAKAYIRDMETDSDRLADAPFDELYTALLCTTSAPSEVQYTQTILLNAMEDKVAKKEEQMKADDIQRVFRYDQNKSGATPPVNAHIYARVLVPLYKNLIESLTSVSYEGNQHEINTYAFIKTVNIYDLNTSSVKAILDAVSNARENRKKTRNNLYDQLLKKRPLLTTGLTAVVGAGIAAWAAPGAWAPYAVSGVGGVGMLRLFGMDKLRDKLWSSVGWDNDPQLPITAAQERLYYKTGNHPKPIDDDLIRAFTNELILLCVMCNVDAIESKLDSKMLDMISELTHVARFHVAPPDETKSSSLKMNLLVPGKATFMDLLPSQRFITKHTLTEADKMLVNEYSEALLTAVTAALCAGLHLSTTLDGKGKAAAYYEALYRTCFPPGTEYPLSGPMANVLQDLQDSTSVFKFKDGSEKESTFRHQRRWHLYSIFEAKRHGMIYFPFSKQDKEAYEISAQNIKELSLILRMMV